MQNGGSVGMSIMEEVDSNIVGAEKSYPVDEVYDVPLINQSRCHISSMEVYKHMYERSLNDSENFWSEMATGQLRWRHPFSKVSSGSFVDGNVAWFLNGKLNVCDNCVDRWAETQPDNVAIIWEGDEPENIRKITFKELQSEVCKCANLLKYYGVTKGQPVCIYMPMIPEVAFFMLACTRIGAPHSVVFAGFSSTSLRDRIQDAECSVVVTADQGVRGGKYIPLKDIMDEALTECPLVKHCIVYKHTHSKISWLEHRDVNANEKLKTMRPYCPIETMDSEDPLFILYTSGSTGKPKGIQHTTAGYLLGASLMLKYIFDVHPGDVMGCVADVGWITGHTAIVYGPLCNGTTTLIFESIPTYPNPGRYWSVVQRHKITQLYTAPTAIRALMRFGDDWPKKYDLTSLRVLASVGEPLNPKAWRWYYNVIGGARTSVVDNFWQTETGSIMLTALPGATRTKPGSVTFPFFGYEPVLLDPQTGEKVEGNPGHGLLCFARPFPSLFRTVYKDHERYMNTYFKTYPGYYFTGDGAVRDKDGYMWISGRVDDTLNVSGHRLGAAEIEHALVHCPIASEAAVVGYPHELKGTGIFCYVTLKDNALDSITHEQAVAMLKISVRTQVGPIATPDVIVLASALPKTRSGKIMRRILRLVAAHREDELGDVSTLSNPEAVTELVDLVANMKLK